MSLACQRGPRAGRFSSRVVVAVVAWLLLPSPRVLAFDYVEHARISHAGIRLFLGLPDPGLGNDPPRAQRDVCAGASKDECELKKKFLASVTASLGSTRLCTADLDHPERDRLFQYAPAGCFSLSDLPALAGDHAATPILLRWKWFNDFSKPQDPMPTVEVALRLLGGLAEGDADPGTSLSLPPSVTGFLSFVRRYASRPWAVASGCTEGHWDPVTGVRAPRECAADDSYPGDAEFMRYDATYGGLAERGHAHFRPSLCAATQENVSVARRPFGPALQAFAWYADLHAGAIELARWANSSIVTTDEARLEWRGAAVVLELYALHFLEDAVAAGHMQVNVETATNTFINAVHDQANREGVWVEVPRTVCEQMNSIPAAPGYYADKLRHLKHACERTPARARVHGDHYLEAQGTADEGAAITFEWAAFEVAASLQSLWDAREGHPKWAPSTNWEALLASQLSLSANHGIPVKCLDGEGCSDVTPEYASELRRYGMLASWFSTQRGRECKRRDIIRADLRGPELRALHMIPLPVALYGQHKFCDLEVRLPSADTCRNDSWDTQAPPSWADVNDSFTAKDFGGRLGEVALGGAVNVHGDAYAIRAKVNLGIALPPRRFPAQFFGSAWFTGNDDRETGITLGGGWRQFFGVDFGLFAEAGAGVQASDRKRIFAPSYDLGLGYIHRGPRKQIGLGLYYGYDALTMHILSLGFIFGTAK